MAHSVRIISSDPNHSRYAAIREDGTAMSAGTLVFRTIHFAGRPLPCGAVGGVGTDPEFRRGGLVREIFREMALECHRRSLPVTVLHPFSFAYYRSFGFERVGDHRVLRFPITALSFVPRFPDLIHCTDGLCLAELTDLYHAFAEQGRHLLFRRTEASFPTRDPHKKVYISRDEAGRADGYLVLETENYFSVNRMVSVNLHVHEMAFLTEAALRKLLGFLRMFEGEMETVQLENIAMMPEVELCLRHYMHTEISVLPDLMARINHVPLFFESVPYPEAPGSFTVKVTEPPRSPWPAEAVNGVWRIDYAEGRGRVTRLPDTAPYDFSADTPALTQLAFGYDSYGYSTARYTENTVWHTRAPGFFAAFPRRPGGIFEHF